MKEFKKINEFNINRNGEIIKCFIVQNDVIRNHENGLRNFHDLYPQVKIDDKIYNVIGVESFAIPEMTRKSAISIAVKE